MSRDESRMWSLTDVKQRLFQRHMRWRLSGFARVLFWSDKFEARFTFLGRWQIAAVLLTLVIGANMKKTDIYQMFAVLLAVLLVALLTAWLRSLRQAKPLMIKRVLPAQAQVGQDVLYAIHLTNAGHKTIFDVRVLDLLPHKLPSMMQFLTIPEPGEAMRNWYDRNMGFYRFVWLQRWLSGGHIAAQLCEKIEAGATQTVMMLWHPEKRGIIHFETIQTAISEPLGLVYNNQHNMLPQNILVLPKIYEVPQDLVAQGHIQDEQTGQHMSARAGDAEAFFRMRDYRPGDSPRHIHWPSLARREKPLVKAFEAAVFAHQTLIIDNAANSELSLLFEDLVSVAAGFVQALQASDGGLDVLFAPNAASNMAPHMVQVGSGQAQAQAALEVLAAIDLSGEESFSRLKDAASLQKAMHSCVVLTLIWNTQRKRWIESLRQQGIAVMVYLIAPSATSQCEAAADVLAANVRVLRQGFIAEDLRSLLL